MSAILAELTTLLAERKRLRPTGSYTVTLLDDRNRAAQKVGEEAVEVIVAALGQTPDRLIEESADLLFHLLVLLEACDVPFSAVEAALAARRK